MNRRMKRGKDRKYDKDHQITLLLTDNSWIKEFTASKEITLESHSCLAFRKSQRRMKKSTYSSLRPICCPSAVYPRESPPIVHHSLNNRPWLLSTRHLLQCSAERRGQGLSETVCQSKLKALKCALGGYDVCVASLTIIQHLCGMQLFFCVMTTMTRWLIYWGVNEEQFYSGGLYISSAGGNYLQCY